MSPEDAPPNSNTSRDGTGKMRVRQFFQHLSVIGGDV